MNAEKDTVWRSVAEQFNAVNGRKHNVKQLKLVGRPKNYMICAHSLRQL